jgi:hypothetical protein
VTILHGGPTEVSDRIAEAGGEAIQMIEAMYGAAFAALLLGPVLAATLPFHYRPEAGVPEA